MGGEGGGGGAGGTGGDAIGRTYSSWPSTVVRVATRTCAPDTYVMHAEVSSQTRECVLEMRARDACAMFGHSTCARCSVRVDARLTKMWKLEQGPPAE